MLTLLFPTDPLSPTQPDEHFAWRARAAVAAGRETALVDMDTPLRPTALRGVRSGARLVLQGWMLTAERYAALCEVVRQVGATMVTGPGEYARAHHLPGWYETFSHLTPASRWLPADADAASLIAAARDVGGGPVVVKDWVRSRKHEWSSACYAPDPESVPAVVARMVALQGADLTGGVVVREFEEFRGPQARAWWVDGRLAVVTAHPDTADTPVVPDTDEVGLAVRRLGCPFVTTDLIRRADGAWRVVEVGDGQVSDFPRTGDYGALLGALALG